MSQSWGKPLAVGTTTRCHNGSSNKNGSPRLTAVAELKPAEHSSVLNAERTGSPRLTAVAELKPGDFHPRHPEPPRSPRLTAVAELKRGDWPGGASCASGVLHGSPPWPN